MSTSTQDLERPPRAVVPTGNLRLPDGRLLLRGREDSAHFAQMRASEGIRGACAVWRTLEHDSLLVMASMDAAERFGTLLHVSLSYNKHHPSWTEIKQVKDLFYGAARDAMMVLPREQEWVNMHDNCFHLWELPEAWGMR